ncbi:SRPBCC family protein [Staphylococcus massiliensis]|uniref:Activator of Hsp90 ATPase homologue 1/2-like C-terminal domain-containing protein n=1 Tax=Staphylococcus massiliensis S46 TaxID=1229783 RepID=K9B2I7_9STAP|nr:SRPBCC domain-containing protein [Staphylococcus massiliensis]EKU49002.1 hypothetical protein C273_04335 [Staphylococcus massiliensis S46]MCG3399445.1 SRPBCC domain-containing protein [Staphylococcus massiliensis]MCG3402456.1 SRPBCC domain-containing protein [Staphylococcus massiliensis]MCG3411581.1 SRPBCC domain-containing protein [Staphylococcus massiliensis]PNZ99478.1 SRPBCC domain-containing protein [Staphylococcus massiliensis CCUG 55927]
MQEETVQIEIVRLMKVSPETLYQAWLHPELLRQWFLTTPRTNQKLDNDPVEGGTYEIIDAKNQKELRVVGTYQVLIPDQHIVMTMGMPHLSDVEDLIELYFEEREPGICQMTFRYQSDIPKERRLTRLEYKQKKKEYHDSTVHGFEMMFDKLQQVIEEDDE